MTTEVLTGYTESGDDGVASTGILQESSNVVTFVGIPQDANVFLYKDFGAAYFAGSAYFEGKLNIASFTGTLPKLVSIGFSDTLAEPYYATNAIHFTALFAAGTPTQWTPRIYKNEATTNTSVSSATLLNLATDYYYRAGFLSSLGRYGGAFLDIYSDAGFSTLVATAFNLRTAANSYRYFHAISSLHNATVSTTSGTNGDITLFAPAAGLDLTAFAETDAGTDLDVYANCIVGTTMANNVISHISKDYTAGFLSGNYKFRGVLNVTAASATGDLFTMLSLVNVPAQAESTSDRHSVKVYNSGGSLYLYAQEVTSSTLYESTGLLIGTVNNPTFVEIERDTSVGTYGTLYVRAYYDPAYTAQIGSTVSLTLHDNGTPDVVAFRYLCALQSYSTASARNSTFTIGGVYKDEIAYVDATKGAFSWAGTAALVTTPTSGITATVGAFSWAGKASSLTSMVQATRGAFSWAGLPVNLNTGGQVNTTVGAFSWAGKSSPLSYSIAATVGAFSWAGKTSILGAEVVSLRSWRITKYDTATSKIIPVTGLTTVKYLLFDPATALTMDLSDGTFKAYASCTTPKGAMTERDATNFPGWYDYLLSTTGLSGLYQESGESYSTDNYFNENPVRFQDGIEYLGGLTLLENATLNAVPTAITAVPAAVLVAATLAPIAANIEKVNSQTISGAGTAADPWGP